MKPGTWTAVVCALVAGTLSAPAVATAQPEVRLAAEEVVVAALTPGGSAALLGVMRWPLDYVHRIEVIDRLLVDEDGDGSVVLELPEGLSERSAWTAVDLATGGAALAAPEDSPTLVHPVTVYVADQTLLDLHGYLSLMVVRPGNGADAGAWFGLVDDGGGLDADGLGDGVSSVQLGSLAPVGATLALPAVPTQFAAGDVVVGIDAESLLAFVVTPVERNGAVTGGAR